MLSSAWLTSAGEREYDRKPIWSGAGMIIPWAAASRSMRSSPSSPATDMRN
jgi:hypothetical protein